MTGEAGRAPFSVITWYLPYNWGKARKITVRVAGSRYPGRGGDLAAFLGAASTGLLSIRPHRLPVGDQSALGWDKCIAGGFPTGASVSTVFILATRFSIKAKQSRYTPWWRLGERRYSSYSFLTSALHGSEWSALRPGRALPRGKDPRYPLYRRLGGPQSRSRHRGYRKSLLPLPGIETR
jgi:hypothetical protein